MQADQQTDSIARNGFRALCQSPLRLAATGGGAATGSALHGRGSSICFWRCSNPEGETVRGLFDTKQLAKYYGYPARSIQARRRNEGRENLGRELFSAMGPESEEPLFEFLKRPA